MGGGVSHYNFKQGNLHLETHFQQRQTNNMNSFSDSLVTLDVSSYVFQCSNPNLQTMTYTWDK